jgi:hypothetical protein
MKGRTKMVAKQTERREPSSSGSETANDKMSLSEKAVSGLALGLLIAGFTAGTLARPAFRFQGLEQGMRDVPAPHHPWRRDSSAQPARSFG